MLLTVPKRKGRTTTRRKVSAWVRRQREQGESMRKGLYCGFVGRNGGSEVSRLRVG